MITVVRFEQASKSYTLDAFWLTRQMILQSIMVKNPNKLCCGSAKHHQWQNDEEKDSRILN